MDLILIIVVAAVAVGVVYYLRRQNSYPLQTEPWGGGVGPAPGERGPVIPPDKFPPVLTRTYEGSANTARQLRQADAEALAARGYYPASSEWIPQRRGWTDWIVAFLLIVVVIGIVMIVYYLTNPTGLLTITYERRLPHDSTQAGPARGTTPTAAASEASSAPPTKTCPDCAESVLAAARICRYCRHEFWADDPREGGRPTTAPGGSPATSSTPAEEPYGSQGPPPSPRPYAPQQSSQGPSPPTWQPPPSQPPGQVPSGQAMDQRTAERLASLEELRRRGLINAEEYATKRDQILSGS